jgi:hypothetical protein
MMILVPVAVRGGKAMLYQVPEESLTQVSVEVPTELALEMSEAVNERRSARSWTTPEPPVASGWQSTVTRHRVEAE